MDTDVYVSGGGGGGAPEINRRYRFVLRDKFGNKYYGDSFLATSAEMKQRLKSRSTIDTCSAWVYAVEQEKTVTTTSWEIV